MRVILILMMMVSFDVVAAKPVPYMVAINALLMSEEPVQVEQPLICYDTESHDVMETLCNFAAMNLDRQRSACVRNDKVEFRRHYQDAIDCNYQYNVYECKDYNNARNELEDCPNWESIRK